MGSILTIRSKWRDKEWTPEPGSKLGGCYTYVFDGALHTISRAEVAAGERVGCGTHWDYARGEAPPPPGRGGWELFDKRPAPTASVEPWLVRGDARWSELDIQQLLWLIDMEQEPQFIGRLLGRSSESVRQKARKLGYRIAR